MRATHVGSLRRSSRAQKLARSDGSRSDGLALGGGPRDAVSRLARGHADGRRFVDVVLPDRLVLLEGDLRLLVLLLRVGDAARRRGVNRDLGGGESTSNLRRTDVDLHGGVGALHEVGDELSLEVAVKQRVGLLRVGNVEGLRARKKVSVALP